MDQDSQNRFDTLRKGDPNAWTPADRDFMRARVDYMSEDERITFGSILEAPPAAAEAGAPFR